MLRACFLPACCTTLLLAMPLIPQEIIAHRGASQDAPENTLASLKAGWEQGADAGELDVHMTVDGEVILMHDTTTKRTAGRDRKVVDQTLAEIKKLDAGSWKGPAWAGEPVPTLREALDAMPAGKTMFIEIKCGAEILPTLSKVLSESSHPPASLALIGFSYETMRRLKKALPAYHVYWIVGWSKDKATGAFPDIDNLIRQAREAGFDGLDLGKDFPVEESFVKKVHGAGLRLYAWTIDDPATAQRWLAAGADGVTTNRPGWLRRQIRK